MRIEHRPLRGLLAFSSALALIGPAPSALAQSPSVPRPAERSRVVYDAYILGPGDSLQIELLDIPELSGTFSI